MDTKCLFCEIAPLGMKCVYGDGKQLISCGVHQLNHAIRGLMQYIPFIGNELPDYHCPDFEPWNGDT